MPEVDIDRAFRDGDLAALGTATGDPPGFPNCELPWDLCGGHVLQLAIYHSPIAFIRRLLELGCDPNYRADDGFTSLIAAIDRKLPDRLELIQLLAMSGADIGQRGVNDFTPVHHAVVKGDRAAVELLLTLGADPSLRTRIDHYETPREMAERRKQTDLTVLLRAAEEHVRRR